MPWILASVGIRIAVDSREERDPVVALCCPWWLLRFRFKRSSRLTLSAHIIKPRSQFCSQDNVFFAAGPEATFVVPEGGAGVAEPEEVEGDAGGEGEEEDLGMVGHFDEFGCVGVGDSGRCGRSRSRSRWCTW